MLKIRLSRTGKKRQPSYRIVVANVTSKRDGRVVERIGIYNPLLDPAGYRIDEGRALHWLSVGAQPTDAVKRLLVKQGTVARLGRLHAGEDIDALVAEFNGEVIEEAIIEEEIVEAIEEAIIEEEIVEAIEEAIVEEEIVEAIEEAIVEEAIAEAIEEEIVEEEVAEAIEEEIVEEEIAEAIEEEIAEDEVE